MKPRLIQKCKAGAIALAVCLAALPLLAQSPDDAFAEMRLAFQQLNYIAARTAGEKALQDWQKLAPAHLIEVYQVMGIIAYTEGNFFEAKTHFEAALSLQPDLRLDSMYVSPKIQQFLREVQENLSGNNGHAAAAVRYVIAPDARPQAALRSLLFPGLGQLQKHQPRKARFMMIAAGAGLAATGVLHFRREAARESYLSATTIAKAISTYKRYNLFNRARNGAALVTAGIWTYSFFDALLASPNQPGPGLSFVPSVQNGEFAPLVSWRFQF